MALSLLVTVVVALVALMVALLLDKLKFTLIPVSAFQIALGAIVGGLWIELYDPTNHESGSHGYALTGFPPELFSTLMLPIIIFEAGWNSMETRKILFHNLLSILAYAVFGTVISTIIVALVIYWIMNAIGVHVLSNLDIVVLATLISAVDPVATLSVFSQLEAHPVLNVIVFGESVLNDAVAIIMFRALVEFYGETTFDTVTGFKILGRFLLIGFGSIAIGIAVALVGALILKYAKMQEHPVMEMMYIVLLAFLSFFLTEVIHLSGVIAIFFFGIAARHYLSYNLSKISRKHGDVLFGALKEFAEMMVFVLLGMQLFFFDFNYYDWALIGATIFGCLVGRAFNIFPLSILLNLKRKPDNKITYKMQLLMWWAGLRGAVAYVLAMSVPLPSGESDHDSMSPPDDPHAPLNETFLASNVTSHYSQTVAREEIITTTHTVIIFTILVLGGPTGPLLKLLKLAGDAVQITKEEMEGVILRRTRKEAWILGVDKKYLIPFFSNSETRRQIKNEQRKFQEKLKRKTEHVGVNPYKASDTTTKHDRDHHETGATDVQIDISMNANDARWAPVPGQDAASDPRDKIVALEDDSSTSSSSD